MNASDFEIKYIKYIDVLASIANGDGNAVNSYDSAYEDVLKALRKIFPTEKELIAKWIRSQLRLMCKTTTELEVIQFSDAFFEQYKYSLFKFDLITEILRERAVSNLCLAEELKQVFACMENGEITTDALYAFVPFLFYLPPDEEVFELVKRGLLLYDKWDDENNTVVLNLLAANDSIFKGELLSWIRNNVKNEYVRLMAHAN